VVEDIHQMARLGRKSPLDRTKSATRNTPWTCPFLHGLFTKGIRDGNFSDEITLHRSLHGCKKAGKPPRRMAGRILTTTIWPLRPEWEMQ